MRLYSEVRYSLRWDLQSLTQRIVDSIRSASVGLCGDDALTDEDEAVADTVVATRLARVLLLGIDTTKVTEVIVTTSNTILNTTTEELSSTVGLCAVVTQTTDCHANGNESRSVDIQLRRTPEYPGPVTMDDLEVFRDELTYVYLNEESWNQTNRDCTAQFYWSKPVWHWNGSSMSVFQSASLDI